MKLARADTELNRSIILAYIASGGKAGRSRSEIRIRTKLNLDTISVHCTYFHKEGLITKLGRYGNYVITDEGLGDPRLKSQEFFDASLGILRHRTLTSNSYVTTDFKKDDPIEMELYEFANRIGGLITYVMIEALRPKSQNRFSNLTEQQAREFAITWVENSIKSRPIFTEFRHLIIGPLHGNVSRSFELPEAQFKRLQEALSNIYPNIFDELEQTRKQLPDYVEYYRELVRRASVKS